MSIIPPASSGHHVVAALISGAICSSGGHAGAPTLPHAGTSTLGTGASTSLIGPEGFVNYCLVEGSVCSRGWVGGVTLMSVARVNSSAWACLCDDRSREGEEGEDEEFHGDSMKGIGIGE